MLSHREIVDRVLQSVASELATASPTGTNQVSDPHALLAGMLGSWQSTWQGRLPSEARTWIHELKGIRNKWAHNEQLSWDDAYRAVTSAGKLLRALSGYADPALEQLLATLRGPIPSAEPATSARAAIVACTKLKRSAPAPASQLYDRSPLFRLSMSAAAAEQVPIFVMSSKYGVIPADTVVEPYERDIEAFSAAEYSAWTELLDSQLRRIVATGSVREFMLFAGRGYREPLFRICRVIGVRAVSHPKWRDLCKQAFPPSDDILR